MSQPNTTASATVDDAPPTADQVTAWLTVLCGYDHAIEIRAPKCEFTNWREPKNVVSRFAPGNWEAAAKEALKLSGHAPAVYLALNGVSSSLPLGRNVGTGATAADIPRRCWLLVDFDPNRPGTVNATDQEKKAAVSTSCLALGRLMRLGWPDPIIADSGNGYHLLYPLNLPADDVFGVAPDGKPTHEYGPSTLLVKRVLAALASHLDTAECHVDTGVFDLPRLVKCYGTRVCKGEDTPERPARYSRILQATAEVVPVSIELLEAMAAEAPQEKAEGFDLAAEIERKSDQSAEGESHWDMAKPGPDIEARVVAYLAKCDPAISGSRGHDRTFSVACKIGPGFDLPPDTAVRLLREHYNPRCEPPWSEKELRHKISESYKIETRRGWIRDAPLPNGHPVAEGGSVGSVGNTPPVYPEFQGGFKPLRGELLKVHPLIQALIPPPLRGWLVDIARRGCYPLEFPTAAALVALSVLLGRNLAIRPKRHDSWTVIPNAWGAIVGPPGLQKSPAVEEALLPMRRLVAEAIESHRAAEARALEDTAVAEARAAAAKKRLIEAARKGAPEAELRGLAAEANGAGNYKPTPPKRYIVNDSTVEKLGELLQENQRGLLQFRDELTGFFRTLDRQGHESDRGFYLETWTGNGAYTFDRIGRGTIHVDALCLSVFGTIQPGPLAKYLKGAASGEDADGFMPRFQVLMYPDPIEHFVNIDRWPNAEAKNEAFNVFRWIDALDPVALGAERDEDRGLYFLRFDPAAQELFDEWREDLENRLRSGTESAMMASHLAKYRSLMPSLALIFHVVASRGCHRLAPVTHEAAELAAAWCEVLESHARRIYQSAVDGDPEAASRLGERLRASLPSPFTFRQVANKGWSGLDTVDDVRRAVGILEDRGWVKVLIRPPGPTGGRLSEEVWVNPAVLAEGANQ